MRERDKIRQVTLRAPGGRVMHTWLDNHPRLRVGVHITLKGEDDTLWEVVVVSDKVHEKNEIKRTWNPDI